MNLQFLFSCGLAFALVDAVPAGEPPAATIPTVAQGDIVVTRDKAAETVSQAKPGEVILLADGVYRDVSWRLTAAGTAEKPITLRASLTENETKDLNRLLQELAWDAVTQHPLSGVKARSPAK
jgi:hypothetical protein